MSLVPKLYLNNSPQTQEDGTLTFARNLKLGDDGKLCFDYGYKRHDFTNNSTMSGNIVGHIVGINDLVYLFTDQNEIIEFNNTTKSIHKINSAWHYSNGKIDGCVNTNISGEKILTIAEYDAKVNNVSVDVPIKHINLSFCSSTDDESFYTQAPKIPLGNLNIVKTYCETIPNGTYVFYIRYMIREGVYTPWMLCSNPIFAGSSESVATLQGGVKYINLHKDSAKSFVLNLTFVDPNNYKQLYKKFQLGFIISHDNGTDARIWKSFDLSDFAAVSIDDDHDATNDIYFDYNNITETNIDELTNNIYNIYNVKNVTSYKNKLYISNYKESDFNPEADLTVLKNALEINQLTTENTNESTAPYLVDGLVPILDTNYNCYGWLKTGPATSKAMTDVFNSSRRGDWVINAQTPVKTRTQKMDIAFEAWLYWHANYDPDKAVFEKTSNYISGNPDIYPSVPSSNLPFGNSWVPPGNQYEYTLGCTTTEQITSTIWLSQKNNSRIHPFYDKGITFIYGSNDGTIAPLDVESRKGFTLFNKDKAYIINSRTGWPSMDRGFSSTAREAIKDNFKKEIKACKTNRIAYVAFNAGAEVIKINPRNNKDTSDYYTDSVYRLSDSFIDNGQLTDADKTTIYNYLASSESDILPSFIGLDENGNICISRNENVYVITSVYIVLKRHEFNVENIEDYVESTGEQLGYKFTVSMSTTDYNIPVEIGVDKSHLSAFIEHDANTQLPTLIPMSKYRLCAHLITNEGIITNGIKVKDLDINIPAQNNTNKTIYIDPRITTDLTNLSNKGYIGYFLSIANIGDHVMQGFDLYRKDNRNYISCLEIDALLYNVKDKIKIYNGAGTLLTSDASYLSSGNSNPLDGFGNVGIIYWDGIDPSYSSNTIYYIVIPANKSSENLQYNKCTPYLPLTTATHDLVDNCYYGSYYCNVKKPSIKLANSTYVSGNDVYKMIKTNSIELKEFDSFVTSQIGNTYHIKSNFNLNYLSLVSDINDKIFRVGLNSGYKQVAKVIDSLTLSFIYELKAMYNKFHNKTFSEYIKPEFNKLTFDNTVRVSNVLSDETSNNSVFIFDPTDYYNVPTNKGIIVKLFAIATNIYVHTKGSLFRFDGNQTITASDKDIKLTESEPFEVGITSVIDNNYDYGGILDKASGCVTYDAYFFYDAKSNHIFAYSGNSQLQTIDNPIASFLKYFKFTECITLHDVANKRILFNFRYPAVGINITLSYNYRAKCFVSVHDITLAHNNKVNVFSTADNCYAYKNKIIDEIFVPRLYRIPTDIIYERFKTQDLFGLASATCSLLKLMATEGNEPTHNSCFSLSILYYTKEHAVEVLDSINISAYAKNYINSDRIDQHNYFYISNSDALNKLFIKALNIHTDTCKSINLVYDENVVPTHESPDDYKKPKYDKGIWSINYFRDQLNKNNIYGYPDSPRAAYPPTSDNYSLIYGRYFIINLEFHPTRDIEIDDININTSNY